MKKLLILSAILIFACTDSEGNPCVFEPTLTTEAATDITETSATLNGVISIVSENCDVPNNTEQGFVYSTEIQPTLEDTQVNVNGTSISTTIQGLEPNTTYYVRAFLTNNFGDFYGDEVSFSTTDIPCDVVYLDDNGVTIKACSDANVGDVGTVNGIEYTIVDREMLDQMLENNEDVSKACTTKITDMSYLISIYNPTEYPIGNWDVSNVINMCYLLCKEQQGLEPGSVPPSTGFSQDISKWNVANVINMTGIFALTGFNQPIEDWDVSNVTNMTGAFYNNEMFNQEIGNWDVSNVIDMTAMFMGAYSFNKFIGDWDVSNVTNMTQMFCNSYTTSGMTYNQPMENWDVSNVTNMAFMFAYNSTFNQDIENWDVSNVTNMMQMFAFNPMAAGEQDLSNWNVTNVINCSNFAAYGLDQNGELITNDFWTTQPNFINCTP